MKTFSRQARRRRDIGHKTKIRYRYADLPLRLFGAAAGVLAKRGPMCGTGSGVFSRPGLLRLQRKEGQAQNIQTNNVRFIKHSLIIAFQMRNSKE